MRRSRIAAALLPLLICWASAPAVAGEVVVEGSLEHSDYPDGEATSLSTVLAWRAERWSLSLTVPVLRLDTPFLLRVGRMSVPTRGPGSDGGEGRGSGSGGGHDGGGSEGRGDGRGGGSAGPGSAGSSENRTETGLGDPVLRLDRALPGVLGAGVRAGLFGAVKAPVAEDRLGTGEWDAGAGLFLWRTGLLTDVYLELGAWALGEPVDRDLSDPLTWEAYLTRRLPDGRWAVSALTRGATEVVEGVGSTGEAGVWVGRSFDGSKTVGLLATAGLGDASPDWAVGLTWRFGVPGPGPGSGP